MNHLVFLLKGSVTRQRSQMVTTEAEIGQSFPDSKTSINGRDRRQPLPAR